jgi:hypothetical protein
LTDRKTTTLAAAGSAVLFAYLTFEVAARLYLALSFGVALTRPGDAIYHFYPALAGVVESSPRDRDEGSLRVLLLGGSVLESAFGDVDGRLERSIEARTGRKTEVVNLACRAHTTLDSLHKYRHLQNQSFDLVIVYHGINETRANNCPARVFKEDYSHYSWYHAVNTIETHPEVDITALPLALHLLWNRTGEKLGWTEYLSTGHQTKWTEYGRDVKTAGPFRRNIEDIIGLSRRRREKLMLVTFAYHVPLDYSNERFKAHTLDYDFGPGSESIELWGRADLVPAAIDTHNDVIRSLAAENLDLGFADLKAKMPDAGICFRDICHLSATGRGEFVRILTDELVRGRWLRASGPRVPPARRRG